MSDEIDSSGISVLDEMFGWRGFFHGSSALVRRVLEANIANLRTEFESVEEELR